MPFLTIQASLSSCQMDCKSWKSCCLHICGRREHDNIFIVQPDAASISKPFSRDVSFPKNSRYRDFLQNPKIPGFFLNVRKSPKKTSQKKRKNPEKKISGNCFHREGFFQRRISAENIVFKPATLNGPLRSWKNKTRVHCWYQIGQWTEVYRCIYDNFYGRFTDYFPYFSKI